MRRLILVAAAVLGLAGPAAAKPPVWVVRDADSELVLFGSVHLLPPGLDWRPPALDRALRRADDLWFEIPVDAAAKAESARLAGEKGVLPPGQSLFRLLDPSDAARLMRQADAHGLDRQVLDRLEPWLAEVALAGAAYAKAGAGAQDGVEQALAQAAPPKTRRTALETPAEQLAMLDELPLADQLASLRRSVAELERDPQAFQRLVLAWQAGDLRTLEAEVLAPMRDLSPRQYDRLVDERNARWTKRLHDRLRGRGRTVVVVGMGHLIGPGGVPARLRSLGYSVEGP